jgi:hypothetical protein
MNDVEVDVCRFLCWCKGLRKKNVLYLLVTKSKSIGIQFEPEKRGGAEEPPAQNHSRAFARDYANSGWFGQKKIWFKQCDNNGTRHDS